MICITDINENGKVRDSKCCYSKEEKKLTKLSELTFSKLKINQGLTSTQGTFFFFLKRLVLGKSSDFVAYFNLPQSHSLTIPLLDIYPKNAKTVTQTDNCILMFTEALFKTAKSSKKPKCTSTDEWILKSTHKME